MFPILGREVYGKKLVYFDNAATSQRPESVLLLQEKLARESNANIHRAVHRLSSEATIEYENTRDFVREFINAKSREEIVFTSGTTNSINLAAFSFGERFVGSGDEIIVCEAEHHSDIVPWQMMCERKGARLRILPVGEDGRVCLESLGGLLNERTKLLAVAHVSNVLGIVNPVKEIVRMCHSAGVRVLVDGAQGIVHQKVDVQELDCDFYAFSGHKVYAATGTGVLYGKKELLDAMPPYMGGGEMIESVSFAKTTYAALPEKYEAGTQNFNAVPTLVPALTLAREMNEETESVQNEIKACLLEKLLENKRLKLFGNVPAADRIPLFSFAVEGAHHEDLALILDKMGIAVRSGQMCAEPLMDRFGVTGMVRISLAPYNTLEEAEYFINSLEKAIEMLS